MTAFRQLLGAEVVGAVDVEVSEVVTEEDPVVNVVGTEAATEVVVASAATVNAVHFEVLETVNGVVVTENSVVVAAAVDEVSNVVPSTFVLAFNRSFAQVACPKHAAPLSPRARKIIIGIIITQA